jgi:MoaA/NifB/PqqE/SkfB family radical SAM enzyme
VLDNFPSLKAIALVGEGEPLLHKGFFTMADMARERGIRVLMLSNGSAFSESVVRKLCESQIAYVSVSIDSIDPATFAQSRIDGDLARIWEGIDRLRRYRDRHGYTYPKIGLKGTLFTHTEDQLLDIVREAKQRGVDLFESFQPLNPKASYVQIYPAAGRQQLSQVERVARRIDEQTAMARSLLPSAVDFCVAEDVPASNSGRPNGMRAGCDEEWIYSLLDGHVTPCCQVKDVIDPDWNLFEHSMQDILRNARYENMRFNLWNGLFPAYCTGCSKTRPLA